MLSCNGIVLNYDTVMYDKTKSKIEIVKSVIDELPEAPVVSYFLCDSWYMSAKLMAPLIKKGLAISTSVPREVLSLMKSRLGLHDNKIIMYRCFVQNLEFAHL